MVAAVIRRDERVLLCRRPAHKRHGGLWEFPGGKLATGETLGEAAARELTEELGVRLTGLGRHLGSRRDPGAAFEIHFVEVHAEGEPSSLEHDEVAWVEAGRVLSYRLAPGDRAFAEAWTGGEADRTAPPAGGRAPRAAEP